MQNYATTVIQQPLLRRIIIGYLEGVSLITATSLGHASLTTRDPAQERPHGFQQVLSNTPAHAGPLQIPSALQNPLSSEKPSSRA